MIFLILVQTHFFNNFLVWPFRSWDLQPTVSQKWINELSWFFTCCLKFKKAKSYNYFWVVTLKNGKDLIIHAILKSFLSQEWIDKLSWFYPCWYKFIKTKDYFDNFLVAAGKNISVFLVCVILKFVVFQ